MVQFQANQSCFYEQLCLTHVEPLPLSPFLHLPSAGRADDFAFVDDVSIPNVTGGETRGEPVEEEEKRKRALRESEERELLDAANVARSAPKCRVARCGKWTDQVRFMAPRESSWPRSRNICFLSLSLQQVIS